MAYETDWRLFSTWCDEMGVPPLSASPVAVVGHLASLAEKLGRSGLRRRLAAIAQKHRRARQPWEPGQTVGAAAATDNGVQGLDKT